MTIALILIPVIPFIASLMIFLMKSAGRRSAGFIATSAIFISLILISVLFGKEISVSEELFTAGNFNLSVGLSLDGLSWFVALITAFIGTLVSLYSIGYMEGCSCSYFGISSFFIGAMLTLVLSSSFLLMYAAWEAVGLSSFLLIGYWYSRSDAKNAARKAFLMTRVGDSGFLLAMLLILGLTGSVSIEYFLRYDFTMYQINLIAILFIIAALGKSAQFPFTAWLPDAMAGPTPVSALIHSATMVAAGVYLLARIFPVFELSNTAKDLVLYIGAFTALAAAFVAVTRIDFKRLLAWSTISQLGEMFFALGLGGALAAVFHLAAHAVFKSALFLVAGAVSHSTGTRNLDELGGLAKKMPVLFAVFLISALSLAGFPPFAGFWSEEEILADAFGKNLLPGLFMLFLIFLAGVYISRAGFLIFGNWKGMKERKIKKLSGALNTPMIILSLTAVAIGIILKLFLPEILVFEKKYHLSWSWRLAAVFASGSGLITGMYWVKKFGTKPLLYNPSKIFKSLFEYVVNAAVFSGRSISRLVNYLEDQFDLFAKSVCDTTIAFAEAAENSEAGFDNLAKGINSVTLRSAEFTDDFERYGFEQGTQDFTGALSRSSDKVKSAQSGKIFVYLLGLIFWLLALSVISIIILIK